MTGSAGQGSKSCRDMPEWTRMEAHMEGLVSGRKLDGLCTGTGTETGRLEDAKGPRGSDFADCFLTYSGTGLPDREEARAGVRG